MRVPPAVPASCSRCRASSAQRKAARVLPEPVGGDDEGVVAVADALPGAFLGGGGCAEGGAEPVAYGGGEVGECVGHVSIMAGFMVCAS